MSDVRQFWEQIKKDGTLQARLRGAESRAEFVNRGLGLASELGYDFTREDLNQLLDEQRALLESLPVERQNELLDDPLARILLDQD